MVVEGRFNRDQGGSDFPRSGYGMIGYDDL